MKNLKVCLYNEETVKKSKLCSHSIALSAYKVRKRVDRTEELISCL
jgi:hypothetical protein